MNKTNCNNALVVKEKFHKFYVCDACGTNCYACVTNSFNSLPCPNKCLYQNNDVKPNWRELSNKEQN